MSHAADRDSLTTHVLVSVVSALTNEVDHRAAVGLILEAAELYTGVTRASVEVLAPDGSVDELILAGGQSWPRPGPDTIDPGGGVARRAVRNHGTVLAHLNLFPASAVPVAPDDEDVVGALADAAGVVLGRARAHRLAERRRRWLEAMSTVTEAFQPPFDLDRALAEITSHVALLSHALAAAVLQLRVDDGDHSAVLVASRGLRGDGPYLEVEAALASLEQDGVPDEDVELVGGGRSTVLAPLRTQVAGSGVLAVVFDHHGDLRDVEERALLCGLAEQAGLAMDRAQAVDDRHSLKVVTERDRVARDLHDVVIQRLFATGMHLQALGLATDSDVASRVDQVAHELDQTVRDIRETIFRLESSSSS